MINRHTALGQDLFQIAIGYAVSDIEENRVENDLFRELSTFERNHLTPLELEILGKP